MTLARQSRFSSNGEESTAEQSSSREYEAPALLAEDAVTFLHSEAAITPRDRSNTAALLQAAKERQLIVFIPGDNSKNAVGPICTLVHVRGRL